MTPPININFTKEIIKVLQNNILNNTAKSSDYEYVDNLTSSLLNKCYILEKIKEFGYSNYDEYIKDRDILDSLSTEKRKIVNVTILGTIEGVMSFLEGRF